jgi:thiol-disulfide isomerase/thioredoxin
MKRTTRLFILIAFPLILSSLLLSCGSNKARISVTVIGENDGTPAFVYFADEREIVIPIDSLGKGELTLDITEPIYVTFYYQYLSPKLFLTPGTDICLSFEENETGMDTEITGKGSDESRYLNFAPLFAAEINDTELSEEAFLALSDSLYNANLSELEKAGLSKTFNELERERLKYFSYSTLPSYPYFHRRLTMDTTYSASSVYWEKLNGLLVIEPSQLQYKEYRSFISEAADRISIDKYPGIRTIDALVKYVESDVTEPLIAEFLINNKIFKMMEQRGLASLSDSDIEAFRRFVKTPELIDSFETLYDKWNNISEGSPSPNFNAIDVNGNKFSLADFSGKYLYIDVWATWCGPCRIEIPHMKELEERYHGKDITFVSISCDADLEAWKSRVNEGMTGVQLHFDEGDNFMDDYIITGIPRFILLDREGKIISSDMSRPSDQETAVKLDQLFKKY